MVEIGSLGVPFRASGVAVGAALAAEAAGMHALWYGDGAPVALSMAQWAAQAGELGAIVADPGDVADPIVTATATLLVARRSRVGLLGWQPGSDAVRAARTIASLADLAPGRAIVGCAGPDDQLTAAAAALRPDLDLELAVYGESPDLAARLGWGWIAVGQSPTVVAKLASDAGVTGTVGIHLLVLAHEDPATARAGLAGPLLAAMGIDQVRDGIVVGTDADLDAAIDGYVEAGVTRIVLDDLLPFGRPTEPEGSRAAIRASVRRARLRHRVTV